MILLATMAQNWSRDELIVTFNLYCKIPFAKSVKTNPDVIKIANLIGRTPSAVAFKLGNFGSFDPDLKKRGIGGLPNTGKLDLEIWNEFNSNWEELAYQSELLTAKFSNRSVEEVAEIDITDIPPGLDRQSLVRIRVNQSFFRRSILSIYNGKCCITGLNIPSLLIASHIIPWKEDEANRTNPQNGLCLNALHDKAFDVGLITITTDYRVKVSARIGSLGENIFIRDSLLFYENREIRLPEKFLPNKDFLDFHNRVVFE